MTIYIPLPKLRSSCGCLPRFPILRYGWECIKTLSNKDDDPYWVLCVKMHRMHWSNWRRPMKLEGGLVDNTNPTSAHGDLQTRDFCLYSLEVWYITFQNAYCRRVKDWGGRRWSRRVTTGLGWLFRLSTICYTHVTSRYLEHWFTIIPWSAKNHSKSAVFGSSILTQYFELVECGLWTRWLLRRRLLNWRARCFAIKLSLETITWRSRDRQHDFSHVPCEE